MDLSDLLLKTKSAKILSLLQNKEKKWYIANLARESNSTYAYTKRVIERFSRNGLVSIEKIGKYTIVIPTEKGLQIASILTQLFEVLK